jgi:hypothetical protein
MMAVEDSLETEARPAPKARKKSERKRRVLKPVTGARKPGAEEFGLDDISIVTPNGPILDPFFEAPTSDPRRSALNDLDPELFEEPTNFPEARHEYHSHPEEITSKMEALVLSQIASLREWSGEASETDQKQRPQEIFEISEISQETSSSSPHMDHETQPGVPAMNPMVADLLEETSGESKAMTNGKGRTPRKRKNSKT